LRILLSIVKGVRTTGNKVILRDVSKEINNILKLTGFINFFEME
jgi:anti-anti-sigma regulatory factor